MSKEIPIQTACSNTPCCVDLEEGKRYFWCTCGKSAKEPYCDGAHKGTEMKPLPFVADSTETVLLCRCKKTQNPPYCDGSHSKS